MAAVLTLLMVFPAFGAPLFVQAAASGPAAIPKEYVIKLMDSNPALLNSVGTEVRERFKHSTDPRLKNIFTFFSAESLDRLRKILADQYEYLEAQTEFAPRAGVIPDDPGFTTDTSNTARQWGLATAQFPGAWEITTGSQNVTVAVIDTGVDQTHEDLKDGTYVAGFDFTRDTAIDVGTDSDDNGHGTLVTGVIAATPNNSKGIAGGAWQVTIMPLKALDADGSGNSTDISEAIVWAADHGADIINMSLGGIGFAHDTTLANAISHAYHANALVVAAAGNDVAVTGGNLDKEPVFPVCDDNGDNMVLGVAALDQNDTKPEFSNFGKNCIDVAAPGKRILSTINHDPTTHRPKADAYALASGTSLAVPFVVAEAVLIKARSPFATNKQIRDRIIASVDRVNSSSLGRCGGESCAGLLGAGRINAVRALADAIKAPIIDEGDVVQLKTEPALYYISGGKRHFIIPFVKAQRFATAPIKRITNADLQGFPEGGLAEPFDGTLIKSASNPTVFYMSKGFKLPVTSQVFRMRQFNFSTVVTLADSELAGWLSGSFLPPAEGSVIRGQKTPTLYWVIGESLHAMNRAFYLDRGIKVFPVTTIPDNDLKSYPKGEDYIR